MNTDFLIGLVGVAAYLIVKLIITITKKEFDFKNAKIPLSEQTSSSLNNNPVHDLNSDTSGFNRSLKDTVNDRVAYEVIHIRKNFLDNKINQSDFEEYFKKVLESYWLYKKLGINHKDVPLNLPLNDLRLITQHLVNQISREKYVRLYKSSISVRFKSKENALFFLVSGRKKAIYDPEGNFILDILNTMKERILEYEKLSSCKKVGTILEHCGLRVHYTSKNNSYFLSGNEIILSNKAVPVELLEFLENISEFDLTVLCRHLFLYVLGFDCFFETGWGKFRQLRDFKVHQLLKELNFFPPRELINRVKYLDELNIYKIDSVEKEFVIFEIKKSGRIIKDFKKDLSFLIYNFTNSMPLKVHMKSYKKVYEEFGKTQKH